MARTVGLGIQDFEDLITKDYFYVDKTAFIREWWESGDAVTLITRPRRFGKTLNMNMLERFFSVEYAGRGEVFERLSIWEDEEYRQLQGSWPVIALSFASVKETTFTEARKKICRIIERLYNKYDRLLGTDSLNENEKRQFKEVSAGMEDHTASDSLHILSDYLSRFYGKKVIILLDEYDTPMQEAYVHGYWEEMMAFTRSLFNAAFRTNPYLGRALMTGITRISRESMFSDLNNLNVVTTTSDMYADSFGFTQREVCDALEEYGLSQEQENVREWYDGFTFGEQKDIYNPWSIVNYLKVGRSGTYWANTSSNRLAGKLIREGSRKVKETMEDLLDGKVFHTKIDEQIVFSDLDQDEEAIWSLLLASGYLRVESVVQDEEWMEREYGLVLTNKEVRIMFMRMIRGWFAGRNAQVYNAFVEALLQDDLEGMNEYMNELACEMFSAFDTGKKPSGRSEPERFYHGFVLGLLVDLKGRYSVTSNRESGFGRYDVMLEPVDEKDAAVIIEFKVFRPAREKSLEDTVKAALRQIEDKRYEAGLVARGIPAERIRKYGFAFQGKTVLVRRG